MKIEEKLSLTFKLFSYLKYFQPANYYLDMTDDKGVVASAAGVLHNSVPIKRAPAHKITDSSVQGVSYKYAFQRGLLA